MILKASGISKSYHQAQESLTILSDLALDVSQGETVAIVGKSGAGKSTLLSILSGLDYVDQGELLVLGQDLTKMGESELTDFRSKNIGVVFQNFHLLPHLTALENVLLPMEINDVENSYERGVELLEKVGLAHRQEHLPGQLSGGEKQRVAVARALSISPQIILADEPSGSLDEDTGEEIMKLLFDLVEKENRSMILVTHDMDLAQKCHRKLSLEHGKLNVLS
jgi:putative ABC transport system ATP-binding protein